MIENLPINDRIYFINENRNWGGGEKMFMWLSKKLYERGYNIKYCMLYRNDEIDTSPVPTDYLDFKYSNSYFIRNIRYFIVGTYKIAKYIKKNDVKQVVCFGFNSFYILGFLKHFMGFKLLVSERGDPRKKRFSFLRKILFAGSDGSVFQTQGARNFYDKNKDSISFVIPNPVELPSSVWTDIVGCHNVISVGRIDFEQKRQDLLILAFSQVIKRIPDAKLYIVGKGDDEKRLIKLIEDCRLSDNVKLMGFKKNVLDELKRSNVFVLTSDFEGIPNALLEAMAFGMPVVSTDCTPGGAAYLIGKDENGLLVRNGDANEVANAIVKFLENPELRCTYASKARKSMERFSEDTIINQWELAINKIFN